jgi:membrane protein DedA with SNARE-associated domain
MSDELTQVVALDATDEDALREVDITSFDAVVVAMSTDFEASVLTTVSLKDIGVRRIICKALDDRQRSVLLKVGANQVVMPEHEAGQRLAYTLTMPLMLDQLAVGADHSITEFTAPASLAGRTLRDADFFGRYGAFSVFLGHFFGPVRAVIPVVARMFAMRQLPFQVANVASALIWAAGVIAPSFYLVAFKDQLLPLLRDHELIVSFVLFVLAATNSVPRPFLFLPTLILFAGIGALHIFAGGNFLVIWLAGAAGAMVGDMHAYVTGKRYQGNLKGAWPWTADASDRARARSMIERMGVPAVIVSKFRGFNRGLVPLMAGAKDIPLLPFIAASAASALLWSAVLLLPAIAIGLLTR